MRKDLTNYKVKVPYKKKSGMILFFLHRITGVILGIFFILHILSKGDYISWFSNFTDFALVKAILFITIVFHTLNGVRIILMEFSNGAEKEVFQKHLGLLITLFIFISLVGIFAIF